MTEPIEVRAFIRGKNISTSIEDCIFVDVYDSMSKDEIEQTKREATLLWLLDMVSLSYTDTQDRENTTYINIEHYMEKLQEKGK